MALVNKGNKEIILSELMVLAISDSPESMFLILKSRGILYYRVEDRKIDPITIPPESVRLLGLRNLSPIPVGKGLQEAKRDKITFKFSWDFITIGPHEGIKEESIYWGAVTYSKKNSRYHTHRDFPYHKVVFGIIEIHKTAVKNT